MTDKKLGLIGELEGLKYAVRDNDYRTGYNRAVNTSINLTKATLAEILEELENEKLSPENLKGNLLASYYNKAIREAIEIITSKIGGSGE